MYTEHEDPEENPFRTRHRQQPPDKRLCPRCLGMRFLTYDVPPGYPKFSQVVPCPQCRPNGPQP